MTRPQAPVPPYLPPGRVINLPGRGEVFVRDSGGAPSDPAVLLLHGWTGRGWLRSSAAGSRASSRTPDAR